MKRLRAEKKENRAKETEEGIVRCETFAIAIAMPMPMLVFYLGLQASMRI